MKISFLKLILKNPFRVKSKTFLTIISLVIAVILIITLSSIAASINETVHTSMIGNGDIVLIPSYNESGNLNNEYSISYSQVDELKKINGISKITPVISKTLVGPENNNSVIFLNYKDYYFLGIELNEGKSAKTPSELVISKDYNERTQAKVGDVIYIDNKSYNISGIFSGNTNYMNSFLMPSNSLNSTTCNSTINQVILNLDNDSNTKTIESQISKVNGVSILAMDDTKKGLYKYINITTNYLYILALLIGSAIVMYTTLSSVSSRRREIGVLKAVGWNKKMIITMIIGESLTLVVLSWVIGSILSIILIQYVISSFLSFTPIFNVSIFLNTLFMIIIIGFVGGLYPGWRASKMPPTEALRYE